MDRAAHGARGADSVPLVVRVAWRVGSALRAVLGAPDYERYLAHMRERHPGEQPLSARDFARRRLEARYDSPGSRCC